MPEARQPLPPGPRHISPLIPLSVSSFFASLPIRVTTRSDYYPPWLLGGLKLTAASVAAGAFVRATKRKGTTPPRGEIFLPALIMKLYKGQEATLDDIENRQACETFD